MSLQTLQFSSRPSLQHLRDLGNEAAMRRGAQLSAHLWLALLCRTRYFDFTQSRKEGCAMTTFFRHYRKRGPVNALQMRLQG
jgi:hypothetical protein